MITKNKIGSAKEFMSHEFYKQFAKNNVTDVTILACKFEGQLNDTENYSLAQTAILKELPSILIETEDWSSDSLITEIDKSYQCIRKYMSETEKISMPEKLNYTIQYLELKEWMDLFDMK